MDILTAKTVPAQDESSGEPLQAEDNTWGQPGPLM